MSLIVNLAYLLSRPTGTTNYRKPKRLLNPVLILLLGVWSNKSGSARPKPSTMSHLPLDIFQYYN